MKYILIFSALSITGFISTAENSPTIYTKVKNISKDLTPAGLILGCLTSCAGGIAALCHEPGTGAYNPSSIADIAFREWYTTIYPDIKTCAECAPHLGAACCVIPPCIWCLSSCVLEIKKHRNVMPSEKQN